MKFQYTITVVGKDEKSVQTFTKKAQHCIGANSLGPAHCACAKQVLDVYPQQIQEFRTGATRQNMETVHAKEESKKLRQQLTDLRSKVADLEARVCRN